MQGKQLHSRLPRNDVISAFPYERRFRVCDLNPKTNTIL